MKKETSNGASLTLSDAHDLFAKAYEMGNETFKRLDNRDRIRAQGDAPTLLRFDRATLGKNQRAALAFLDASKAFTSLGHGEMAHAAASLYADQERQAKALERSIESRELKDHNVQL